MLVLKIQFLLKDGVFVLEFLLVLGSEDPIVDYLALQPLHLAQKTELFYLMVGNGLLQSFVQRVLGTILGHYLLF